MKKFLLTSLLFIIIILSGCVTNQENKTEDQSIYKPCPDVVLNDSIKHSEEELGKGSQDCSFYLREVRTGYLYDTHQNGIYTDVVVLYITPGIDWVYKLESYDLNKSLSTEFFVDKFDVNKSVSIKYYYAYAGPCHGPTCAPLKIYINTSSDFWKYLMGEYCETYYTENQSEKVFCNVSFRQEFGKHPSYCFFQELSSNNDRLGTKIVASNLKLLNPKIQIYNAGLPLCNRTDLIIPYWYLE